MSASGEALTSLRVRTQSTIIAAAVLLSPILAFLLFIAVEILMSSLIEVGLPALIALAAAGIAGWAVAATLRARLNIASQTGTERARSPPPGGDAPRPL